MTVSIHVTLVGREPERTNSLRKLEAALAALPRDGFAEVWVNHDSFPSLCVLVNGSHACLIYLRYGGDAGFSSRNPAYQGHPAAMIEYHLSNGQCDRYPAGWAYPSERALEAVAAFARERRVPEWLQWSNDSGDGASSPNDAWPAPSRL